MDAAGVYARLNTRPEGLTADEAQARLEQYGPNVLAKDQRAGLGKLLWHAVLNPLVILLAVLATISFATGDPRAGIVMSLMIVLSVGLKLIQEAKADSAAAKLKAMISVHGDRASATAQPQEIAVSQLVPGDVVQLAAGDMIPGDVRDRRRPRTCSSSRARSPARASRSRSSTSRRTRRRPRRSS